MPFVPPSHSPYPWQDLPSTATPLNAANLEAAEQDLVTDTRNVVSHYDTYAQGLFLQGDTGALQPAAGSTRTSTPTAPVLRDFISVLDFGADRTGNVAATTALQAAIAEAQAIAASGYARSRSATVRVPAGRYLLDGKISIPDGVIIDGDGWGSTVFHLTGTTFPDNCVFEPVGIDFTQEFIGLRGFTLYGAQGSGNLPTTNQPNGGAATTSTVTVVPNAQNAFDLTVAGVTTGYASNGTLSVAGNLRVIYQSKDDSIKTFHGCYTIDGAINAQTINPADTVAPITTNNVRGIHCIGVAGPTFLRDLWISNFTGECLLSAFVNAIDYTNIVANYSNRDCILHLATRASATYRAVSGQYAGVEDVGGTYAGMHVRGTTASSPPFGNSVSVNTFYSEQTSHNAIGLRLQDAGSFSGDNINLQGGVNTSGSYATQTGILIDSTQSTPLIQDGSHAANVSLRNLHCAQIGRVLLNDSVRGYSTPANTTTLGRAITRYDTEDHVSPRPYFSGAGKTTVVDADFGLVVPPNGLQVTHFDSTASKTYISVRANGTWHVMAGPL